MFLFACSSEDEEEIIPSYTLELRYTDESTTPRLTFIQISLPNYVLDVSSPRQTFNLDKGMVRIDDVRVTLTFSCEVGNNIYNEDVLVNFYEDITTVLEISRVVVCNPDIKILYE